MGLGILHGKWLSRDSNAIGLYLGSIALEEHSFSIKILYDLCVCVCARTCSVLIRTFIAPSQESSREKGRKVG